MHRQSIASRSQFGQSSAQTATAQALRNKKREYEAISALEQSCAELIATLEDMATDLNTNAEATIGTISSSDVSLNSADGCLRFLAIGKAMEHWTDMFQILSISRASGSDNPPSQGYALIIIKSCIVEALNAQDQPSPPNRLVRLSLDALQEKQADDK